METIHTSPNQDNIDELEASLALQELAPATPTEHDIEITLETFDVETLTKAIGELPVAKTTTLTSESYVQEKEEGSSGPSGPSPQEEKTEHELGCSQFDCDCEEKANVRKNKLF